MSRTILRCGAFLTFLAAVTGTVSCTASARAKTETPPSTAAVRATLDKFFEDALRRDWDATLRLMSDDFMMFTDGAQAFDKAEYARLLKADDIQMSKYELRDVSSGVSASGDMAWMTYKGYFEQTMHGTPGRVETTETLLFRNEGGAWRMFRAHASVRDLDAKEVK